MTIDQTTTVILPEYSHILLGELRIYIDQAAVGDCWKSGKTDQDVEFYLVSVTFEQSVSYDELNQS